MISIVNSLSRTRHRTHVTIIAVHICRDLWYLALSLYSHVNEPLSERIGLVLSVCMWKAELVDSHQDLKLKHTSSLKVLVAMWVTGSLNFHDDRSRWHSPSISISVAHRNSGVLSLRFMRACHTIEATVLVIGLPLLGNICIQYFTEFNCHQYNIWILIVIDIKKGSSGTTHVYMEHKLFLIKYNKTFKYPSNQDLVIVVTLQIFISHL